VNAANSEGSPANSLGNNKGKIAFAIYELNGDAQGSA
jgi:hypothetical protein